MDIQKLKQDSLDRSLKIDNSETGILINADCMDILPVIPDKSIQLILLPKTSINSCFLSGIYFAVNGLPHLLFFQTISYLNNFSLLRAKLKTKSPVPNKTMFPFGANIRSYSFQSCSNGKTLSHLLAVVPYGKSTRKNPNIII